jgi:hypothetical protein
MFLNYINNFRAIATLFVVFNHSVSALGWGDDADIERLVKIIYTNGAVLFTFIAGFLFQHLLDKFDYKTYLVARFKLVVCPYLIISIPAVIVWAFVFQKSGTAIPSDFYQWPGILRILYLYATGIHLAPVWFIPMIVLFYLSAPFFYWLDRHPKLYYLLPALMVLSYIVPRHWNPAIASVHFLSVYVFGMFCSRYKERIMPLVLKLVIPLVVTFVALVVIQWKLTYDIQGYYNYWNKLIVCLVLISLLDKYEHKVGRFLLPLATINFSIFFLHSYVLTGIKIIWMGKPAVSLPIDGNFISHFMFASMVVVICVLITIPARRLLGTYSRNVIGS